jgi:radical SAM superfamily enzyme YgiQ (UPF0313 family)
MNKKAILLAEKYGFYVNGSLVYGSPSETIEDMKKTNDFIELINSSLNFFFLFLINKLFHLLDTI